MKTFEFEQVNERIGATTEEWIVYNQQNNPELIEN